MTEQQALLALVLIMGVFVFSMIAAIFIIVAWFRTYITRLIEIAEEATKK